MNLMMIAALVALLMAELPLVAEVVSVEDIPAFDARRNVYSAGDGARARWTESGDLEVVPSGPVASVSPSSWIGAYPGQAPFPGADAFVLTAPVAPDGVRVTMELGEFPKGGKVRLEARLGERTRFAARGRTDPARLYRLERFGFSGTTAGSRIVLSDLVAERTHGQAAALRFDFETGSPLRLVRERDESSPRFVISNLANVAVACRGSLHLVALFDGERRPLPVDAVVPAGGRTVLPLPTDLRKGVWQTEGELASDDGSKVRPEARFAVVDRHDRTPQLPEGRFRFGLNYHMLWYSDFDRRLTLEAAVAAGAKLVRAGIGANLYTAQTRADARPDFTVCDRLLGELEEAGLAVNTEVLAHPDWAADLPYRTNASARAHLVKAYGPTVPGVAGDFAERLAGRYGTRIAYYEVGNEWDLTWPGSVDEAVRVQREMYEGVKRACPGATVICGGWAASGNHEMIVRSGHRDFQEDFLRKAADWIDVVPIHIHGHFSDYVKEIGRWRELCARAGVGGKPWYSNETAMPSNWGELRTAAAVWQKMLWAWSAGSRDYVWYNLRGTGYDPADTEQGFGLFDAHYRPRAGFVAFAAVSSVLGGGRFVRTVFHRASRYVLEFRDREGRIVFVGWDSNAADPASVGISFAAGRAWKVDLMGNRTAPSDKVRLGLGRLPEAVVVEGASDARVSEADLAAMPDAFRSTQLIPNSPSNPGRRADFVLEDRDQVDEFFTADPANVHRQWRGPDDSSAQVWLHLEPDGILLWAKAKDDVHCQPYGGADLYQGDSLQVVFGAPGLDGLWEFGLARRDDGRSSVWCWRAPKGRRTGEVPIRLVTARTADSCTVYEAHVPYSLLGFGEEQVLKKIFFNVLVNDNDGDGRDAAMEPYRGNFSSTNEESHPAIRFERPAKRK